MALSCGAVLAAGTAGNMALPWYHRDLSRAAAEEILAKAGRDGSFLVRDSESVTGAYALCVQKHVHTYRILPDEEDHLAVQTSQGGPGSTLQTLGDLIALYLQPNQGMVCTLLYPVEREKDKDIADDRDYSDGEDEKPPLPPRSASASFSGGSLVPSSGDISPSESSSNGLSTVSHDYLKGSYALDLEAVKSGATSLPHLNKTLVHSCKRLHGEVDKVLSGLEILSKIFDQQSSPMVAKIVQQAANQSGEQELESLVLKLSVLKDFLSSIEKKGSMTAQGGMMVIVGRPCLASSVRSSRLVCPLFSPRLSALFASSVRSSRLVCPLFSPRLSALPASSGPLFSPRLSALLASSVRSSRLVCRSSRLVCPLFSPRLSALLASCVRSSRLVCPLFSPRVSALLASCVRSSRLVCPLFSPRLSALLASSVRSSRLVCPLFSPRLSALLASSVRSSRLVCPLFSPRLSALLASSVRSSRLVCPLFSPRLSALLASYSPHLWHLWVLPLVAGEEEITFPPTYRYERGSRDTYVWHKHKPTGVRTNVPSWCDRILWKSHPETHMICNSYGCTDDIMTSDHSPVFASFEVGVTSQFVSKKGLLKPSDQAYIEFESVEAIVKTASRTKFFIEFYSGCLEEYKKSSENDSQSIDNINFLKVQWSSRQLPTLRPILSEIEYLQDQHLLLTVKSMDGYESYGECVIALKSMIGSTAQQFLTYLSHRGEETGNIRGCMKVRVPAERMGTRERLYEWISIDKDETGAVKGKPPSMSRPNHEYTRKPPLSEAPAPTLGKVFEEPEKGPSHATGRPPAALPGTKENPALARCKMEAEGEGLGVKNSFNNPAYYVLEGVPHQLLPPDGPTATSSVTPKNKVQITVPAQQRRPFQPSARSEETSSDEDGGTLNLPPPDFPPPPLPKSAEFEMLDNPFYMTSGELHPRPAEEAEQRKVRVGVTFSDSTDTNYHPKTQSRPPIPPPQASFIAETHGGGSGGPAHQDDRSCSVLQMARTLSEVDYSGGKSENQSRLLMSGKGKMELPPRSMDFSRPLVFPPHCIRESIQEDLAEEAAYQGGRNSLPGSSVGEWLQAIGLERYEEGLIHNGWDDLEFLSDIVEEDLEEAGVLDPTHKKIILDNLQLRK
ncbi:LOW QUALITY PROTEIN: phosphatidylinositol 3,4,5-trisphosphate 5-phosphatase 2 [Anomaloglossus baeobatrachus]